MAINSHLLKIELPVSEYEEIISIKGAQRQARWQEFPNYLMARCPFCLAENIEKIDTYSLSNWKGRMTARLVSLSAFNINLVTHHCQHFALVQTIFSFSELPPEAKDGYITNEPMPYVIGHLLESDLCQAVIHALPICRIEYGKFIPRYTLLMISYFSRQPPDEVYRAVHRYNDSYYSWEASGNLYLPLEFGEPHWADLSKWVAAEKLYWVDAFDPELNIKTQDVSAFPYK